MAWLPIYITEQDLANLSSWLNNEECISNIKTTGKNEWRAFNNFELGGSGRYCLYHSQGGPLPLLSENPNEPDKLIENPFTGWKEQRSGANPELPFFGAGEPAIFWLNVRLDRNGTIGLSSFEWIGNHYASLGKKAPEETVKWWARLRRWTKKQSTRIPRSGPLDGEKKEIYAFEGALSAFKSGTERAFNP